MSVWWEYAIVFVLSFAFGFFVLPALESWLFGRGRRTKDNIDDDEWNKWGKR